MEIIAQTKSAKISPRKARLVADSIRKSPAKKALIDLLMANKKGADVILKTLKSAIANAVNNAKISEDNLFVKNVEISQGSSFKRFHPSTRGRVHPYKKRMSHIKITLEDKKGEDKKYGTKS